MRIRNGPRVLWLLRHGQSEGNVARDAAEQDGLEAVDLGGRDADVPLSALGERQAVAFGRWLAEQPDGARPTVVVASPYVRAQQTARLVLDAAGGDLATAEVETDERLRDRELGVWDLLTWRGIQARDPDEAERAVRIGRYFHRPPGGESWADILLRLRAALSDLALHHRDDRVLLVLHDVPIQLVRAAVEGLDEAATVDLVRGTAYANCGLTVLDRGDDGYDVVTYNHTVPVEQAGEPATQEPDVVAGPR